MMGILKNSDLIQRDIVRLKENYWSKNVSKKVSLYCSEDNLVNQKESKKCFFQRHLRIGDRSTSHYFDNFWY